METNRIEMARDLGARGAYILLCYRAMYFFYPSSVYNEAPLERIVQKREGKDFDYIIKGEG